MVVENHSPPRSPLRSVLPLVAVLAGSRPFSRALSIRLPVVRPRRGN